MSREQRVSRWYFGGIASAMACCCTHPLDLLKVQLQTQQEGRISVVQLTVNIVKRQGVRALYNGLSASLLRQLTYSTTRFGIYESVKQVMDKDSSFASRVALAAFAGSCGGLVGTPADKINVRMQNDIKLPPEKRLNYAHAIEGLWRVYREEGFTRLFSGATTATGRAALMTVGQLSFYDQIKKTLLTTQYFEDNLTTHFVSSLSAGAIATTLTQPLDVLKTRTMNAKPGEFKGMWDIILYTAKLGPLGFFKGYVPAFVRLAPQTILTFVFLEQLRFNFGFFPDPNVDTKCQTFETIKAMKNTENLPRWYFGGLASSMATFVTHPLDLIKVQLQTRSHEKVSIIPLTIDLVKKNGIIVGLYSGLSASLFRQMTYSTARFAIYDTAKAYLGKDTTFATRIFLAAFAGMVGGFIGTPGDKVNVRMQNDVKLPPEKRIRYKHVFDGLWRVYKEEGFSKLFAGGATASVRAGVMAVGQMSFYDQIKKMLLQSDSFQDNLTTHFTCSLTAAAIATTMTQPLDVLKTRLMNAKPGEFKGIIDCILYTAKEGPFGFFKGYVPAFLRIGPHTILMFVFYEQLRMNFGYLRPKQ